MKRHHLKYVFDLFLTITFLLLMDYATTGLLLHEIIGLGILAMFLFHQLINIKWIEAVGKRLFSKQLKAKPRAMFLLDVLLLVDVTLIGVSGVLVSVELFPWIILQDRLTWVAVHHITAYAGLIMISIHIGLHWKAILNAFRLMLKIGQPGKIRTVITRTTAILIMIAGIQATFQNDIVASFTEDCSGDGNSGNGDSSISDDTPLLNSINATASDSSETAIDAESYDLAGQHRHGDGEEKLDSESIDSDHEEDSSCEDEEDTSASSILDSSDGTPTLKEFLSSLRCTACNKHCPLSNPKCIKGERQAQEATLEYNDIYAQEETSNAANGTTDSGNVSSDDQDTGFEITDLTDNVFADYLPVMGLFIGGTFYTIEILTKVKR